MWNRKTFGIKGADNDWTPEYKKKLKSIEEGASTTLYTATAAETAAGGFYLEDCEIKGLNDSDDSLKGGYRAFAKNPESAAKLWELSVKATGVSTN